VYEYDDPADREVVGFIASSFALGRVKSILDSAAGVLKTLPNPAGTLRDLSSRELRKRLSGFRYRFFSDTDLFELLAGIAGVLRGYGSLERCFTDALDTAHDTTLPALAKFVAALREETGGRVKMLPDPGAGSACKRLHLFLRWMVRRDAVDPGLWRGVSPSLLVVPMDVHMHRISIRYGMTKRKQADMKTALEVTRFFKTLRPDDPVRYDFCLTRMEIHPALKSFDF
jgi:uncharacterized protein (TIGR02757 family)